MSHVHLGKNFNIVLQFVIKINNFNVHIFERFII